MAVNKKISQGKHVRARFPKLNLHAHGVNMESGEKFSEKLKNSNSDTFRIRIQDPERGHELTDVLGHVSFNQDDQRHGIITALEVALDVSRKDKENDTTELAQVLAQLWIRLATIPNESWHLYRKGQDARKGDRIKRIDSKNKMPLGELIELLNDGWHLASSVKDECMPVRAALYVKTSDGQDENGKRIELDRKDWSARCEFLYQGTGLDWADATKLKTAKFEKLTKHFKFIDPETGRADRPLNELARDALRKLTTRWAR